TGVDVEIIDFKTNRIDVPLESESSESEFDSDGFLPFDLPHKPSREELLRTRVVELARLYLLQMQCYALAVRLLIPEISEFKATLHFLDKDQEYSVASSQLELSVCEGAVDRIMTMLNRKMSYEDFAPRTGGHCRRCGYLAVCPSG